MRGATQVPAVACRTNAGRKPRFGQKRDASMFVIRQSVTIVG